jgi:hypothetical protein
MLYEEAVAYAREESRAHECTMYVEGRIVVTTGQPRIDPTGWSVTDWYSPATVVQFSNGKRVE